MKYLIIYITIINVFTYIIYGVDKKKAIAGKWRIPEKVLIGFALLGGSLGAFAGMQIFHHKTKHRKFRMLIPLFLVLHIVLIGFVSRF